MSLLCVISKVFEKVMYNRLLETYKILTNSQFGFRKSHSTYMALMTLMDRLITSLENDEHVIGIFLDFSKAFDTVDHAILLKYWSILGPLLFLIYINDLCSVCKHTFPILFADDTNLFSSGKEIKTLETNINNELSHISIWLKVNKLSLNIKNTH